MNPKDKKPDNIEDPYNELANEFEKAGDTLLKQAFEKDFLPIVNQIRQVKKDLNQFTNDSISTVFAYKVNELNRIIQTMYTNPKDSLVCEWLHIPSMSPMDKIVDKLYERASDIVAEKPLSQSQDSFQKKSSFIRFFESTDPVENLLHDVKDLETKIGKLKNMVPTPKISE